MVDLQQEERGKNFDPETQELRYASFNSRIFAGLLDLLFSTCLIIPFVFLRPLLFSPPPTEVITRAQLGVELSAEDRQQLNDFFLQILAENLIQLSFLGALLILCWLWAASTPGKMLLKMRIVDAETGQAPTTKQWLKRLFGYVLAILPIGLGFFWIAISKRRQGVHDIFAGTVVVQPKYFGWRYVFKISLAFLQRLQKKLCK